MTKRVAFVWLVLTLAATTSSQTSPEPKVDIYALGLVAAAQEMDRQWGRFRSPTHDKYVVVQKDASVMAEYPSASGQLEFKFLTGSELRARRKRLKSDFPALLVKPATVVGPRLTIDVLEYAITLKRGQLAQGLSGWAIVFFRFDPAVGAFRVEEVKLGGI